MIINKTCSCSNQKVNSKNLRKIGKSTIDEFKLLWLHCLKCNSSFVLKKLI